MKFLKVKNLDGVTDKVRNFQSVHFLAFLAVAFFFGAFFFGAAFLTAVFFTFLATFFFGAAFLATFVAFLATLAIQLKLG